MEGYSQDSQDPAQLLSHEAVAQSRLRKPERRSLCRPRKALDAPRPRGAGRRRAMTLGLFDPTLRTDPVRLHCLCNSHAYMRARRRMPLTLLLRTISSSRHRRPRHACVAGGCGSLTSSGPRCRGSSSQGWRRSLGDGCFPGDAAARRASATSPSRWKISQGRALRRLGTDGGENQPALEPRRAQAGPTPSATVRTQYASKGPAGLADRLDAAVVGANRSNERAASMARKPGRRSTRTWCQSLLPRVRQPRHEAPRRRPAHRRTRAGPARSGDCDR